VDTPEDFTFAETIYRHFGNDRFAWREVLAAVSEHPEWQAINSHIEQKAL
jgi:spore coat polysaccharide biosynthesis protein SpsF (cytidylyltransferase family)